MRARMWFGLLTVFFQFYLAFAANLWCGSGSTGTCPTQGGPCTGLICNYPTCKCFVNASQTLDDNVTYYFESLTVNLGVTLTVDYYAGEGSNGLGMVGGRGGSGGDGVYLCQGGSGGSKAGGGGGGADSNDPCSDGGDGGSNSGGGGLGADGYPPPHGGSGGGKITFEAADFINISGGITSPGEVGENGLSSDGGGGGGGGGDIYLLSEKIVIAGTLKANGGAGGNVGLIMGGGGGGGGGGGFVRFSGVTLELSGTIETLGGSCGKSVMSCGGGSEYGDNSTYDWVLVNQTDPANGSSFSPGNVDFKFNATSRVNATLSCNITLNGSVIYQNASVISNVTTVHTENMPSGGIKYWNVTCEDVYVETTSNTRQFEITGGADSTPPTYSLNSTNSTTAGEYVEHRLKWLDAGGLSGYVFSFDNCTGTLVNDSWAAFPGDMWSNVTKKTNYTQGCTIQWCVYANDTSNNWNGSSCASPLSYQTSASVYISISFTPALQSGITFGSLDPSVSNVSSNCASGACNISVSPDTTVNLDLVSRVDSYLTRWGSSETLEEQYWNASNTSQPTGPSWKVHTTYDYTNKVASNIPPGTNVTYNAWLSIPSGQASGLYNNSVYLCATEMGTTDC